MRKIAIALAFLLVTSSAAFAEWLVDFKNTYLNEGIDKAVEVAMGEGAAPTMIVENGLQFEGLNPSNLIKALYCAGAQGQDIVEAAAEYNISELMVAAGYRKSVAECSDRVADAQPFTPVSTGTSFVSINPGGDGDNVSPSAF
ncbi:hypothetical protein [Desulfopila inferna]|uniref:hypothetical protein n=1 Tax=Desulfopila inferna TaxID=468528 RepID=UPI00196610E3|nr:hypothetical protein [Desulfopila inferna]MBM9605808.1 hypothetical protein [Desulfopila inferna]